MRKQSNARIKETLIELMDKDSVALNRPVWAIVEQSITEFYTKRKAEREAALRNYPARKGGVIRL